MTTDPESPRVAEHAESTSATDSPDHVRNEVTSGLWAVGEYGDVVKAVTPPDGGGDIICIYPQMFEESMRRWKANARLIAAAPDLLAACKLALGAFTNNNAIDWSELERAIAKAEGR